LSKPNSMNVHVLRRAIVPMMKVGLSMRGARIRRGGFGKVDAPPP
jgi:hypothetical protein